MTPENLNSKDAEMAKLLEAAAQEINPNPAFKSELEEKLKMEHKPKITFSLPDWREVIPALGWAAALIVLGLALSWVIRSLVPVQPAAGNTPTPISTTEASTPAPIITSATVYDWHGTSLSLNAPPPDSPAEASAYLYQPEQRATLESARAFASQLGLNGAAYAVGGEIPGTTDFLIVDGDQRLIVRSDQYFQFYPNYPRWNLTINGATPPPDAEVQIDQFLKAHGFDFPYRIWPSEMYGGYIALPLTPDGYPICYEYFKCAGLHFTLDEKGILAVDSALPKYEKVGQYGIISAEEALQKILNPYAMSDPTTTTGMMEGMYSPSGVIPTWLRPRPTDQTITLYGWLSSNLSLDGSAPLVTLDGYTVTGNIANIPASLPNTFVEATGPIRDQNGAQTFELESWKAYNGNEDGLLGTIERQGEQVILNTIDGETLLLPDVPSDLPLPLENAFVIGVRSDGTFEWKSIDLRQTQGGGGGGGGGLGFYKLNLTGTPVPFPTPEPTPQSSSGEGTTYVVQAGDTLAKIASDFGVSVEALAQVNSLSDPSMLQVGQTLVIPSAAQSEPQKVEGLRGLLSINIYKKPDGSQRVEYGLVTNADPYPYLLLEGENLDALQAYQNRPLDVWGTLDFDSNGTPVVKVERYEIPFPDLQFQILRGRQKTVTIEGQPATLFTTADGQTYVQFSPGGGVDGSTVGNEGDEVLLEALIIPGETFGGYPALRVFSASMAISPKNGQPIEMQVTSDQLYVYDEPAPGESIPPTATIERVELVYYMPDPRYLPGPLEMDQRYLQPAWLFLGHYSDGSEFFILVQALKIEFLLPEVAPYTQPG